MNYELNYKITDRLQQLSCPTKRSQRYEQNLSLMTMSRLYDNHFNKDIHERPWISQGTFKQDKMIKYEHSDAGLSFTNVKIKKLRTFQELWEKNEEIHSKSNEHQGFRKFREFEDIEEEDVIVTIEYCTQCTNHLNSTKHDEAKYLKYAQTMKNEILNRFPICKVILKPLIYDHLDHSIDTMFLQRRLGCFEVQVMSKQKGKEQQAVIGSKLSTKQWPQIPLVINKLPQYFKKVTLNLEFKFAGSDQKLKQISVKIQPFRQRLQTKNGKGSQAQLMSNSQSMSQDLQSPERSNHHLTRPQSSKNPGRPYSASSQLTAHSQKTIRYPPESKQEQDTQRVERTNEDGKITLRQIPLDVYEILIDETNDFLSTNTLVDLFKLSEQNQPFDVVIELKKQTHSCICVQVQSQGLPLSECKVEIIPMRGGKEAILKESPSGSGKYEIVVEPGSFKVFVKKIGYFIKEDQITTRAGVCEYKYEIQQAPQDQGYDPVADALAKKQAIKPSNDLRLKKPKYLAPPSDERERERVTLVQFKFIDLVSKEPVPQIYIKIRDETNKKLYSYRSNEQGICKAMLEHNIQKGSVSIIHSDYYYDAREIDEANPLQMTKINDFHVIRKPQQSQIKVLILNKAGAPFRQFYILQENNQIIQSDANIRQYTNPIDGIQYIQFENLSAKKEILSLFACLPSLKHIGDIQEFKVLTPNEIQTYKIPELPPESQQAPYFWILGSLKEPYETFDVVNQIVYNYQLKNYPNLTKSISDFPVAQCAFQSPNLIVAANINRQVCIWNLDTYLIDATLNNAIQDLAVQIVIWDDDNVAILDQSGYLVWLRKEENSQQFQVSTSLNLQKPSVCMARIGTEGLCIGGRDGSLILVIVRIELNATELKLNNVIEGTEEIAKMVPLTNDSIAILFDTDKKITQFKFEKSLDRPLTATPIRSVQLKGYLSTPQAVLSILNLEQRYLIFGGADGVLSTLSVDNFERGPNISFKTDKNVHTILQIEQGIIVLQGNGITFIPLPESMQDLKHNQHQQKVFDAPVNIYRGDCQSYEKRLITFTEKGKMAIWTISNSEFPAISEFLQAGEFPKELVARDCFYLLVESKQKIPKENFTLQLIKEDGEIVQDKELVSSVDEREQNYFYIKIQSQRQKGLWRLCAHLQNTEMIKNAAPKISFISKVGFQLIPFPSQIPQSKKQSYNWFIGTLIPGVDMIRTTTFYTDQSIVGKFPSLEQARHQGRINQLITLNRDEFMTVGEDKQIIIWDANSFRVIKILQHEAEVLSIYNHNLIQHQQVQNPLILAGNKDGLVIGWKQNDRIWQVEHKFKYHDKGVYSIIYVDGSFVTSSEDRKVNLVNAQTGALEHQEGVDRTFVISLQACSKDTFAAGFPDGRVKIYKREKSSQKVLLKTMKTIVTTKCQHILSLGGPTLFVGGMDKVSDIISINQEGQQKPKSLKEGHQGSVLCSLLYDRHLVTGGSDGRLNIWNLEKGSLIKTFELTKEEIRAIAIANNLLITASSNGVIRVWQEICPFMDNLPEDEQDNPMPGLQPIQNN